MAVVTAFIMTGCGSAGRGEEADSEPRDPAPWDLVEDGQEPPMTGMPEEAYAYADDTTGSASVSGNVTEPDAAELPDTVPSVDASMQLRSRIGNLGELFNDSNKYQYAVAERIGIRPIRSMADAYYINKPMVEIKSCRWYDLDTLTHSVPYLVKAGADLLETIGRNFADSLVKRGAPGHKFRVTSVLRTSHSVKRLRRVNRNATDSSTHQFGTTFDISYAHFNHYGGPQLSDGELKNILGEVLRDLRVQNKCMVKFERKSPCFHITATGR